MCIRTDSHAVLKNHAQETHFQRPARCKLHLSKTVGQVSWVIVICKQDNLDEEIGE